MELNLLDILSILHGFTAVIFIIYLLTTKSQRPLSNILLSLYFFISIFDTSAQFLSLFVYPKHPIIGLQISEMVYFLMPLFYLFVKSSVYLDFKLSWKTGLHALPYLLLCFILIPSYYIPILSDSNADWVSLIYDTHLASIIYVSLHVQILIYFVVIYRLLFRYKKILLENYSNTKLENYKWLMQFVSVYFVTDFLSMLKNIVRFQSGADLYRASENIVAVLALIIIVWLLLKALRKPELFSGVFIDMQLVKNILPPKAEDKIESETANEQDLLIEKIQQHMKQQEPFLDPNLSMYDLAKQLKVPTRELSITINHKLKQHFFDFVNSYRIKKAMELFRNSDDDKLTVLEVLYQVGFNSKSSFNTAFKKYCGLTPTEYRKKAMLSVA